MGHRSTPEELLGRTRRPNTSPVPGAAAPRRPPPPAMQGLPLATPPPAAGTPQRPAAAHGGAERLAQPSGAYRRQRSRGGSERQPRVQDTPSPGGGPLSPRTPRAPKRSGYGNSLPCGCRAVARRLRARGCELPAVLTHLLHARETPSPELHAHSRRAAAAPAALPAPVRGAAARSLARLGAARFGWAGLRGSDSEPGATWPRARGWHRDTDGPAGWHPPPRRPLFIRSPTASEPQPRLRHRPGAARGLRPRAPGLPRAALSPATPRPGAGGRARLGPGCSGRDSAGTGWTPGGHRAGPGRV